MTPSLRTRAKLHRAIDRLRGGRFRLAKICSLGDDFKFDTCCRMGGIIVRVSAASEYLAWLRSSPPALQKDIYYRSMQRLEDPELLKKIVLHLDSQGIIADALVLEGIALPPFHRNCTCQIEGVFDHL